MRKLVIEINSLLNNQVSIILRFCCYFVLQLWREDYVYILVKCCPKQPMILDDFSQKYHITDYYSELPLDKKFDCNFGGDLNLIYRVFRAPITMPTLNITQ